jgi:hypothetical protein
MRCFGIEVRQRLEDRQACLAIFATAPEPPRTQSQ